jgi:hypothetical protein
MIKREGTFSTEPDYNLENVEGFMTFHSRYLDFTNLGCHFLLGNFLGMHSFRYEYSAINKGDDRKMNAVPLCEG